MKLSVVLRIGLSLGLVGAVVAAVGSVWGLRWASATGYSCLLETDETCATIEASGAERGCDPVQVPLDDGCEPPRGMTAGAIAPAGAVEATSGVREPTLAPPEIPQLPPAGEVLTVRIEAEQLTVSGPRALE
jgi:hypothetical protein